MLAVPFPFARRWPRVALPILLVSALPLGTACRPSPEAQLEQARALQDAGAYVESLEPLRGLLARDPDHAEANYRLGLGLVRSGRTSEGVWPLLKASESEAFGEEAGLLLASNLLDMRNFEQAAEAASRVLERAPDHAQALALRARARLLLKQGEGALEDAERRLARDPDDLEALTVRAGSLVHLRRLDEAEQTYERARQVAADGDPSTAAQTCLVLADFYAREREDAERAVASTDACLERYADEPVAVALAVQIYDGVGRSEAATALLQRTLANHPDDLTLRGALGQRLLDAGAREEAAALADEGARWAVDAQGWAALASLRRGLGDLAGAEAALREALSFDERDEVLRFAIAETLVEQGRLAEAEGMAGDFEEPIFRDLVAGRVALERGDAQDALARLERALQQWPNNGDARMLAARAAVELGRMDEALSHLREATRLNPGESDAALLMARLYLVRGELEQALGFAERHKLHRRNAGPEADLIAARAYAARGDYAAARTVLSELGRRADYRPLAVAELARVTEQESGPEEAVALLEGTKLDLAEPANEIVLRQLAQLHLDAGQPERARALVDRLAAERPDAAALQALRGAVLVHLADLPAARAALERARGLEPERPGTLAALGLLARAEGRSEEAVELLDRAAVLAPEDPTPAYAAAQALLAAGRSADATTRLRRLVLAHPEHAGAANDLAWLLAEEGEQLDLAAELARRAARLAPQPQVIDTLGFVQLRRGEARAAVETLRELLAAHPEYATARYHLALALVASGDVEGARAALRAALAGGSFPEAEAARLELARLEREATR